MITAIDCYPRLFGGPMRAGDLLAACNYLEYIRTRNENWKDYKLYIPDISVYSADHCFHMRNFLLDNTDYLTQFPDKIVDLQVIPGTDPTYSDMFNLWNIREDVLIRRQNVFDIPDAIKIPNTRPWKDKVVIAPLMDAAYNFERNWSLEYTQSIINNYRYSEGDILISKEPIPGLNIHNLTYCHDYLESLRHIMECHTYIGGDTGLSHFAGALQPGPFCIFHYSKNTYGTTNPLNWKRNGSMVYY